MLANIEHLFTVAASAMLVLCVGGALGLGALKLIGLAFRTKKR